jgi:hypothetical protein
MQIKRERNKERTAHLSAITTSKIDINVLQNRKECCTRHRKPVIVQLTRLSLPQDRILIY